MSESKQKKSPFLEPELSSERFEIVLKSISDGVFSVDEDWNLTCFNDAAVAITGIPREEAIGKKCYEIIKTNICSDACALGYTLETGNNVINLGAEMLDSQGKKLPISISTGLLKNKDGKVIGGVETFRDLSMVEHLRKELTKQYTFHDIISQSSVMEQMFSILPSIAESDSTVLIEGESGTGKEILARAIHNLSNRKDQPFVVVNCSAIPETLLESELFGYKAGAFTGAVKNKIGKFGAAEKGTVFLDEVGDIPLSMQVKLLRVIQERTYEPIGSIQPVKTNVRFVAATNRPLITLVQKGLFREDLYYRLNVIRLELPPLKERFSDVPLLIDHFLAKFSAMKGKDISGISSEALSILLEYHFPGNIRELKNIIEYAFAICPGGMIAKEHLPQMFQHKVSTFSKDMAGRVAHFEVQLILEALKKHNWSRLAAAKELGIHKTTLFKKIRKHGITIPSPGHRGP